MSNRTIKEILQQEPKTICELLQQKLTIQSATKNIHTPDKGSDDLQAA